MTDDAKKAGRKGFGVNFKVSAKGAVSVYGLGRFPVTLYREQWVRLLERTDDLKKFLEDHADELAKKGEAAPAEETAPESTTASSAAVSAPAAAAERPAEQTAEGASPVSPSDDDAYVEDADVPPDDYDGH